MPIKNCQTFRRHIEDMSAQQPPVAKRDPLLKESSGTTMASTTTNSVTSLVVARSEHGSTKEPYGSKESEAYVGFANLPTQVYRKAIKKGFEFSLMVVGVSGLGKSTLVNCLFMSDIYSSEYPGPSLRIKKTVQVETTKVVLRENGVTLTLTIIDTPGFGDCVDNSNCWQPILDYIERKYEEYLNEESRVNRSKIEDNRVHCCLYFLAPSGHSMKPLDIEFMKKLHDKVNIIPVIAKADTLTPEECASFKETVSLVIPALLTSAEMSCVQILNELAENQIKIYEFPESPDEDENKHLKQLKSKVPFAIVSSVTMIDANGKTFRGRKYPWGTVDVDNIEHSDFSALKNMLIRTHMQDLVDVTNNIRYENFRSRKLAGISTDGKPARISNKNPLAQMEEEKKEHDAKIKKMEQEMEQVFELKVREKMQKLKDSEADLQRRHEQMKKSLEHQRHELEEKRRAFEKEKMTFETQHKDVEESFKRMTMDANSKDKGVLFLHDNARPHTSCKTVSTIIKLGFEVLEHPAYSPDLALSDYFLFGLLKKELKGKRFDSDEDVQKVVQDFFHTLPKSAYKEGIYKLPERWRRCIESQGDYFE
ncbi:SEPT7 [Cordylochernes scorpioides]|uniref:SEPT7 n=1 Tax=Cordylochernes scorpioides TaxID=51811 RepID=A0ABY6KFT5_9ARAC|nr:SEPT7 [Cordylochernes scorpioides]